MGYVKGKLSLRLFQRYKKVKSDIRGAAFMVAWIFCKHNGTERVTDKNIFETQG